jgi:hypothetical protein
MKNVTKRLVALLLLICSAVALVGCASSTTTYYYDEATGTWSDTATNSGNNGGVNNNNNGNNNSGSLAVEISDVKQEVRYIDDDGMITPVVSNELKYRTRYTLELSFVITPNMDSDGTQFLDTVLTFADINILNGNIKEAETGKQDVSQTIDAATGATRKDITLSFKIPAERDVEKKITILVGIDPLEVADSSSMQVDFKSDDARVLGDGIMKSYSIVKSPIETPTLTYDYNMLQLSWNHVKNATYYKLYFGDRELVDSYGNPYIIYASDLNVGSTMTLTVPMMYSLGLGVVGLSGNITLPNLTTVTIQAFNEDSNYTASNRSEPVPFEYNNN